MWGSKTTARIVYVFTLATVNVTEKLPAKQHMRFQRQNLNNGSNTEATGAYKQNAKRGRRVVCRTSKQAKSVSEASFL